MKILVTGGAGYIGSHCVFSLLKNGYDVVIFDNLSTGQENFLSSAQENTRFKFIRGDILNIEDLKSAMSGSDFVFHFAANADIRDNLKHPKFVFEQNAIGTFNVLEAMRANNIKFIAFSSTGSVYGEPEIFPTPEIAPFPVQTSLYAASKDFGEGMIESYCSGYNFTGYIFRFVSLLGERYPHGHVFDFVKSLLRDPKHLTIIGNGHQKKSYLYIQDCLDAILTAINNCHEIGQSYIFNLGSNEYCEVKDSAKWISQRMNLSPEFEFTGGLRGWTGDSPFIWLDTEKIRSLGWQNKLSIKQSVEKTVDYLLANKWLMEARS